MTRTADSEEAMTDHDRNDLVRRITHYLSVGGFWNPELMDHEKVRDLLMDCRAALEASSIEPLDPDMPAQELRLAYGRNVRAGSANSPSRNSLGKYPYLRQQHRASGDTNRIEPDRHDAQLLCGRYQIWRELVRNVSARI